MKRIFYRKLRELMAKYLVDKKDIANIIGKTPRQTSKYLNREASNIPGKFYVFDIPEAVLIVKHFRELGETELTLDELFFNDVFSFANSNNKTA